MSRPEDHERLAAVYDEYAPRVYAYAARHCGPSDADDVLAETFAVAWRRRDVVPDEPLGWLLVTARNVISSRRRADRRRTRLTELLADTSHGSHPSTDELVVHRHDLLKALESLSEREREALLLTAWDGLDAHDAAAVAGCSPRAFRARLMRARARLTTSVTSPAEADVEPRTHQHPEGLRHEPRPASA
jgi:RNA polymerase sigma factor (sigma-70 family)